MKKRLMALTMAAAMVFTTACSGGGTASPTEAAKTEAAKTEAAKTEAASTEEQTTEAEITEPVTIKFANYALLEQGYEEFWNGVKTDFEAKNPNITIEWVTAPYGEIVNQVINMAGGGDRIDMIFGEIGWVPGLADAGLTIPVDEVLPADYLADFYPAILDSFNIDGKPYGLPMYVSPYVLYYNTELFEQAGLDPNSPPATYDEMLEYAEKLSQLKDSNGNPVYAFGQTTASVPVSGSSINGMIFNFGGTLLADDGSLSIDNQGFKDSITMLKTLDEKGYNPQNAKLKDLRNLFALGQLAMYYDQSWGFNGIQSINPDAKKFTASRTVMRTISIIQRPLMHRRRYAAAYGLWWQRLARVGLNRPMHYGQTKKEKRMKALIVDGEGRLSVEEISMPQIGPCQALVKMESCGVCNGTDRKLIHRTFKNFHTYPAILGHEGVGKVVKTGEFVENLHVGDRVLLPFLEEAADGYVPGWGAYAEYCVVGDEKSAIRHGMGPGTKQWNEAYAAQTVIRPEDRVDAVGASMIITFREVLSAIRRFGFQPNETAVIFGAGPVGLCFTRFLKLLGLKTVITTDILEDKVETARRMGADYAFHSASCNVTEEVKRIFPEGVDYVVDAVGVNALINQAMGLVKYNGKICCYGISPELSMKLDWSSAPYNWTLQFVQWPSKREEGEAHSQIMAWINQGVLDPMDFISDVIPFERITDAFELIEAKKPDTKKIVVRF